MLSASKFNEYERIKKTAKGYTEKRHITKYAQTDVSKRVDGRFNCWLVLTWADLDLITPTEAFEAIRDNVPWKNPLINVLIGTADTKKEAIELVVRERDRRTSARSAA